MDVETLFSEPINVQRSLVDLTGMLPKAKKITVNICFIC